ncbi:MAG: tyrosine-type recombinase/integrase, partial [Acidimicrobiales bacterium]
MTRRRAGTVRKLPSGRWQARYWDPADNRLCAPSTFATKGDAQRWLAATETDLGRGDWHDPRLGDVPYDEWARRWLAIKEPRLAPSTVALYRWLLRCHIGPRFATVAVGRITAVEIQSWLAGLHATHLSPNTVAKAYRVLKGTLDGAVDAGLIPRSPCTIRGAGTERHDEMRIATPEQVAAIAAAVGPRWEALVFTAAYSGLRWGELAGLRRRDLGPGAQTLNVVRKLGEVNGLLSYSAPKTAAGRRTVGIPTFVARSLLVHVELYAEAGDDGLVFPGIEGGPMRRANFRRRVWEPATAAVGVSGLRFHDLRHTAATLAAASGTSLKALMARIGHASVAAAMRYQHVIDGQDAEIVGFLERFGDDPSVAANAVGDRPMTAPIGHVVGTPTDPAERPAGQQAPDQGF